MLDKYLEIQVREQEKVASRDQFVERMMLLPNEELFEIQRTGEIKLAYYGGSDILSSDPDRKTWLDHFKGTPLYARAIALEEEDLKMQAADDQANMVEDQERMQKRQARDALRLEKRLLELELVKSEQAAESAALPPPEPSPGMGAPPMGAQGAGAPGGDAEIGKMAAVLRKAAKADPYAKYDEMVENTPHAGRGAGFLEGVGEFARTGAESGLGLGGVLGGITGAMRSSPGTMNRVGGALKGGLTGAGLGALIGGLGGGAMAAPGAAVGSMTESPLAGLLAGGGAGYALGHAAGKAIPGLDGIAPLAALSSAGAGVLAGHRASSARKKIDKHEEKADKELDKAEKKAGVGDFLRAAAPVVGDFVKKHPGAAIGGGIGALHGLMHQGGGLGSAVLEGAGGAALGHGAEHLYRSGSLQGIKDAVMPPTGGVAKEAAALPPFDGEKFAGHSPEKVFKALRGASAKRVEEFARGAASRKAFHGSKANAHDVFTGSVRKLQGHLTKGFGAEKHQQMAAKELGRKEGLRSGHLHGAAAAAAAGGAGFLAGKKSEKGEEKKAFIGSMLGALGGAAARGGAGGLMSGGLKGLGGTAMNWIKSNPMKAVGGAMNAASNFASARQQGQGLGGAALSGLAGGASALG